MKTWEYRTIDSKDAKSSGILKGKTRESIELYLNELGAEGWELVNIDFHDLEARTSFRGVAKREKQ